MQKKWKNYFTMVSQINVGGFLWKAIILHVFYPTAYIPFLIVISCYIVKVHCRKNKHNIMFYDVNKNKMYFNCIAHHVICTTIVS